MATNRTRRSYTAAQQEEALRLYQTDGTTAASKATGISKNTIQGWARKAGLRTVRSAKTQAATEAATADAAKVRANVVTKAITTVNTMLDALDRRLPNEVDALSLKDLATILGIIADKHRALATMDRGTQNTNAVDMWLDHITNGT